MTIKWQALILILITLISLTLTKVNVNSRNFSGRIEEQFINITPGSAREIPTNFSFQRASIIAPQQFQVRQLPTRKWSVLDPNVKAEAVLIQSLDDEFPFFHYNTYQSWPIASISKLLVAVVVLEEIGSNKKILITDRAVNTEGASGNLKSGEIYTSQDLLKIMLLTSSNDAAVAFEDYFGGRDTFLKMLNQKAEKLAMTQTIFQDPTGLSDLNQSNASDLLKLTKYILEKKPEIFNWTRLSYFLVQPINDINSRTVYNITNFAEDRDFLGGKTGTSDEARENILGIFTINNYRAVVIILGSQNRAKETRELLEWVKDAYEF